MARISYVDPNTIEDEDMVTDQGAECLHQVPFEPIIVEL